MAGVGDNQPGNGNPNSSYDSIKNNMVDELLNTDLKPVLECKSYHESLKAYLTKLQSVLKVISKENKVLANENSSLSAQLKSFLDNQKVNETKNQSLISSLQSQINELKQVKNVNVATSSATVKNITKTNPIRKTQTTQSGQLKLTQFTTPRNDAVVTSNSVPTENKFAALQNEEEIDITTNLEDDSDDTSLSEDSNSDPEFRTKRLAFRRQQRKKRKRGDSKNVSDDPAPKDKSSLKSDSSKISDKSPKVLPPPPIKVIGIKEYQVIKNILTEASENEEFVLKFLGNETWKVNTLNDDIFRKTSEKLNEKGIQWYTHSNKNTRNIQVLCKGLPPSIPEEEIIEDLLSKNLKIKSAVCLKKRVEKIQKKTDKNTNPSDTPTEEVSENQTSPAKTIKEYELVNIPVHQLDFDHTESSENIFKIKAIAHTIVRIEPIKVDNKIVPQCKRCQGFQHTANFCAKTPRCVKCAGKHLSSDCVFKGRITNPKCINCGTVGHPASYRGCPFAKDFQIARKKQLKAKNAKNSPPDPNTFPNLGKNKNKNAGNSVPPKKLNKTFAQAAASNSNPTTQDESAILIKVLLQTIESLNSQLRILTEKVSKLESKN